MTYYHYRGPRKRRTKLYITILGLLWLLALAMLTLETQAAPLPADHGMEAIRAEVREISRERAARNPTPLSGPLYDALVAACGRNQVPLHLALGLIEVESGFRVGAVSSAGCYGLCQLNPRFFPGGLTPAQNINAGIDYLGALLERYGNTAAALCAYNAGHDTGSRIYSNAVLGAAERWRT